MTQTRPLKTNLFNRNADLLHGPIFKNLFLFMLPILVSNLFQQLYNTVDTMIVGNVLGDTALAAIGSCGSIYELLVGFGIGIGNGLSIVAARSYGAQDEDLLKRTVAGALVIGLCASFVITTAGFFGLRPLLQLLDTPAEILEDAYRYISVIDLGVLVMFLYNLCAGLLRAIGNSVMPLVFLLISSGLNVALDLWFIAGLGMGVQGAAVATVIAQGISVVLCILYVMRRVPLLLPARKLVRVVPFAVRKPHLRQQFPRLLFQLGVHRLFVGAVVRALLCQQLPCQHHVLQRRILREEVKVLEHQPEVQPLFADLAFPLGGGVGGVPHGLAVHPDAAGVRPLQKVQAAQQGGLAGAGRADDGQCLALL